MELNIEWKKVADERIRLNDLHFVALRGDDGVIVKFCMAFKKRGCGWWLNDNSQVHFEVTHVCPIRKVVHKISYAIYSIGDEVQILRAIEEYGKNSIGQIVGKYDLMRTWAIKMEDDFVIILRESDFRHYLKGGKNA